MGDMLRYERRDGIAWLTLNAPDRRNVLSVEMAERLREAIADIEDRDMQCVVLTGADGTFCAGGDIESMLMGVAEDVPVDRRIEEYGLPVNRAVQAVAECRVPTVAAVDGPAIGAGGALAIACDIAVASERSKIGFGFRRVGLSVDSGTSALLPKAVGESTAKELVYTGEILDPERATELGLFNRVVPTDEFDERTEELAETIASGPTLALKRSKELLEAGRTRSVAEAIDAETNALETTLASADHEEGVQAFVEGRDPKFEGN